MSANPQLSADLVTFIEELLNGKLNWFTSSAWAVFRYEAFNSKFKNCY